ncbi:MAG: hypothetical protein PHG66_06865 [Candidatus Colwellbacteria bacterium]|nr:hypothetical protein [Candidatus Colwellbacteria bacterium]
MTKQRPKKCALCKDKFVHNSPELDEYIEMSKKCETCERIVCFDCLYRGAMNTEHSKKEWEGYEDTDWDVLCDGWFVHNVNFNCKECQRKVIST